MTALEALQAVQFVTVKKKRFAVIEIEEWEALIEWLTELEDLQIFKESYEALEQAGGNRQQAGWLRWDQVRDAELIQTIL
jgi:hypothetical protein